MAWVIEPDVEGFAIAKFEVEPPPKEMKPPLEYFRERGIPSTRMGKSAIDIEDRFWPRRAKMTTRRKALPSIVTFFIFMGISEDFLECVNWFEPGVHDCRLVEVLDMDGNPFHQKFYAINIRHLVRDVVRWEQTNVPQKDYASGRKLLPLRDMDSGQIYVNAQGVNGLHLWWFDDVTGRPLAVSDQLYECLLANKLLRGLRSYKVIEV